MINATRRPLFTRLSWTAAACGGVLLATSAAAQDDGSAGTAEDATTTAQDDGRGDTLETLSGTAADPLQFTFRGAYQYQFDTDIDDGGEFNVNRLRVGVSASYTVNDDLTIAGGFSYGFDSFDFSGSTGFGGLDPWGDIHTLSFGARLQYRLNDNWRAFIGPTFQFSRESDGDWGDSFEGGGVVGATYTTADGKLTIGGGVGIKSSIEDDVRIYPLIIVNWRINDTFRVQNSPSYSVGGEGLEAVWTLSDKWELAGGFGYYRNRFRLDDSGLAPDGVGQDEGFPLYLRLGWDFVPTASLSVVAGAVVGGELLLEDNDGNRISKEDYDPAGFISVGISGRF